jgi:hypothetical protein
MIVWEDRLSHFLLELIGSGQSAPGHQIPPNPKVSWIQLPADSPSIVDRRWADNVRFRGETGPT